MHLKKHPAKSLLMAYIDLLKLNIMSLVLVSSILGYYLGGNGIDSFSRLLITLFGTTLTAGGAGALNHYLERDADSLMERTKNRPIPKGIIQPGNALMFGILLVLAGTVILVMQINLLTGFLSILTAFLYVLVYTPLKRITWLNTSIGSVPGALPPMGGWAAATGELETGAWILFAIMFLWQHPHFYAIAWMYKEDYALAKFKMLPVLEPDGKRTIRQIFWHLTLLVPVSVLLYIEGNSGLIYAIGVIFLTGLFFISAIPIAKDRSIKSAKLLLKSSVIYLPALLILIIIDKII
ncbi:MAG: heme o synthase [Candidatus Marinimicrobia bacterium]|jgi:protoheme IX farnesyltransferase|nr:protoheme IX farnesyltransferase [Candidatus Neomarinimicrobiota bacterium]MDP7331044.1 heme o synthase [Candidatus Neomarinimicrobiota bacterium]|tara:strand:- start:300 stop:1181 length:882 start_codon:yes stop_codon:yes gene_type:complete